MSKMAAALEYDGAYFCGWQSQRGGGSVQDAVQQALLPLAGGAVTVHAAGRTDAGVHATLQMIHFEVETVRPAAVWVRGVNARLPAAVRMLWVQPAAADFHARYAAERRSYQYLLLTRPVASALLRHTAAYCRPPLVLEKMQEGIAQLAGAHDFSAFRAASCQAQTPHRHLYTAAVRRCGDLLVFDFCADGFLQHMIRNMVGALLAVGQERKPPQWLGELLRGRNRQAGAKPAAAGGLYFTGAQYPCRFGLPESERPLPLVSGGGL